MTAVFWPSSSVLQTTLEKKKSVFKQFSQPYLTELQSWVVQLLLFLPFYYCFKKLSCRKQEVSTG